MEYALLLVLFEVALIAAVIVAVFLWYATRYWISRGRDAWRRAAGRQPPLDGSRNGR